MSPLRGSLFWSINILQRCHPYGVEEEQVKIEVRNTAHKRRRKSNAKNFTHPLTQTVDEIRPSYFFDVTCQGSVPQAITCALESESYEDAVRNAISLGGDSDTLAAIAGPIAEALHGIPDELKERAESIYLIDSPDILDVIQEMYHSQ